ncbi:replicative DNA helicase [Rhabdobacter roseus]|uniref:Replicative DNA helicase n=1 Tax=Rhabdobacter roseus TaxID=1655419 RepID=A0A840TUB7_9BACT|nr:DnaB-like helicase C-terminal domain-containing protein [Rhabdobacter roseus]MBB5283590.1 replicative DNA helicase [Rhabdobacter roseus]
MKTAHKATSSDSLAKFVDVYQERLLVTALAHHPAMIAPVQKLLPGTEVFQDEAARICYECISELHREGEIIRPHAVLTRVRARGRFETLKAAKLSLAFDEMAPNKPVEIIDCAEGILSLFRRYNASEFNLDLNKQLSNEASDTELIDTCQNILKVLTLSGLGKLEKSSKEAAMEALGKVNKSMAARKTGKAVGVPSGSSKLDRYTGGWQEDQLIILAGRPGSGKTSCALDFALAAAGAGHPVGFFSMEMPAAQLMVRLAANLTGIEYRRIRNGEVDLEDYKRIENALAELAKLPLYFFDDTAVKDVYRLEAIASEWRRIHKVELIIIDYIQYLEIRGHTKGYDRVTEVTKAVKTMQRNLKIPVIALAQLSRATEGRSDPRPKDSDLKESGQLEQDASLIIGLFNPEYYARKNITLYDEQYGEENKVPFKQGTYCLYLLKNRDGDVVRVDRFAHLATGRFSDQFPGFQPLETNPNYSTPMSSEGNLTLEKVEDAPF